MKSYRVGVHRLADMIARYVSEDNLKLLARDIRYDLCLDPHIRKEDIDFCKRVAFKLDPSLHGLDSQSLPKTGRRIGGTKGEQ